MDAYPKLRNEILYLVNGSIIKNEEVTNSHLKAHVQAQRAFINVRHPEFRFGSGPTTPAPTTVDSVSNNSNAVQDISSSRSDIAEDANISNETDIIHKGPVTMRTTSGFRQDKEVFAVLFRTALVLYKNFDNFTVSTNDQRY